MTKAPDKPVRVRLAPSPTGYLHIGNLRAALYNWLFARKHGGALILRIEDTDRARYVEGAIQSLYRVLEQTGLLPDEGVRVVDGQVIDEGPHAPYLQSKRREKHLAYAYKLIEQGNAYYCFCSKERLAEAAEGQRLSKQPTMYDRHCRRLPKKQSEDRAAAGEEHVIRLAVPTEGAVAFDDVVRGRVEIPWAQVDDQVLIKSDGFPTYHLAATCDDHDMEISHVIRGEEWLSSMPKHLFIYRSFGWDAPQFAHLPLLLNPDRSKLSKRQGDVAAEDFLKKGYLPDALVNFIALLGWNPTGDREIFSRDELVAAFDLTKVNKAGAIFNTEKLDWLNAHYLRALPVQKYLEMCRPWLSPPYEGGDGRVERPEGVDRACLLVRDRVQVLNELPALTDCLFKPKLEHDPSLLPWKTQTPEQTRERLSVLREELATWSEADFQNVAAVETKLRACMNAKQWATGDTFWPLRVALSGQKNSPGPFELLVAYGQNRALQRIDEALTRLL